VSIAAARKRRNINHEPHEPHERTKLSEPAPPPCSCGSWSNNTAPAART